MITVLFGGQRRLKVPQTWAELHPKTIAIFVKEFFFQRADLFEEDPETGKYYHKDVIAYEYLRLQLLQSILGLNNREFLRISIDERHKLLNIEKICDFMFETEIKAQPIKYLRHGWFWFSTKLYGPVDFNKITAEEFSFADAACTAYIKTSDPKYLSTLIAVLFRPKKYFWFIKKRLATSNGDLRQAFNNHLIDGRLHKYPVSPTSYLAVFWWFHTQRCGLAKRYTDLFSPKNQTEASKYGWYNVILSLAEGGTFGTFTATAQTPMHLVLTYLDAKASAK